MGSQGPGELLPDDTPLSAEAVFRAVLKSVLSDVGINIPDFLSFPFAWETLFHSLTFRLCVFRLEVSLV